MATLLISSNLGFYSVYAVSTNNSSAPWTIEKARHLAKKALFWATQGQINQLFAVGSATNAVNTLFPSRSGPSRTAYDTILTDLTSDPSFDPNDSNDMYHYYSMKKTLDPYEAKAKLFLILEDTFSVNNSNSKDIMYLDIENTHNLIYDYTLGNYKELIKKSLLNNWGTWDYSISRFLDLLNQKDPNRPNQNYSREILQLLLMLEYIPTENSDNGGIRNYSEQDVDRLAKMLVGFEFNENTHEVSYNTAINTNEKSLFLEGPLKMWDSFPFYDVDTEEIDIQVMKNSIMGNNGLPDNIIDYIFSKRENAIAMFLADKLYRFYIAENPSRTDLNMIASEIIKNDFDLYPTVKWLLIQDMMYTSKSMNDIIYKNPLELALGTAKILKLTDTYNIRSTSRTLWWSPYYPGSIFWRDGFDTNKIFFNATTSIKWASEASRIVKEMDIETYIDKNVSLPDFITDLENKIYWEERLSTVVKTKLQEFMTQDIDWNTIVFSPTDPDYNNYYSRALIHFLLIQPEYVLQSGYDVPSLNNDVQTSFYDNDNKLIIVKFAGWLDWLHAVIPKDEYPSYIEKREDWAITGTWIVSLNDDYYINSSLSDFKDLFDTGDLKLINRIGTPDHSRWHDSASRKMASVYNEYGSDADGIIGHFIKNEDPLKTLTLWRSGYEFRWGQTLNVWSDGLYRISDSTNTDFRLHTIDTIKDIYNTRTYPENLDFIFKNWVSIASVAEASVWNGWRSGAGYNMTDNFAFAETLFDWWVTNVIRMRADGWYDTHGNQRVNLDNNFKRISERTTDFYNRVKDKHNVTIIMYSEFGRTNNINSSNGTDHGKAGWMFVLSNNAEWKQKLPKDIYWNNSFSKAQANRLWVWIDYRSIYKTLFETLYNKDITSTLGWDFEVETYLDETAPETEHFRVLFTRDGNNSFARIHFKVNDDNYFIKQGSHVQFSYGTDKDNMRVVSRYDIDRRMIKEDNKVDLYLWRVNAETEYFYKVNIYDNQYNLKVLEWSFTTPIVNAADNVSLNISGNTRFVKFAWTNIMWKRDLAPADQIVLSNETNMTFTWDSNITLNTGTGTVVNALVTNTWTTWDGTFYLPSDIPVWDFISEDSKLWTKKLKNFRIDKLIKVGADTLWVGMNLNKPVQINIPWISASKNYVILFSEDGNTWEILANANITKASGWLTFSTDHFTYFAVAESDSSGNPVDDGNWDDDWDSSNWGWNNSWNSRSTGGGSGWGIKSKDICKYGDYSNSYYDKSCGKTVTAKELYKLAQQHSRLKNIWTNIENDEINYAIEELQNYESEKFDIYTQLFKTGHYSSADQEAVLMLLRQGVSTMTLGDYELYYIKWSTKNTAFKKLAQIFLRENYPKQYKDNIIKNINNLILAYAVMNLKNISDKTKKQAKSELVLAVTSLKFNYKVAKRNTIAKASFYQAVPKKVIDQNKAQQTQDYYKSRKEAILRKHKQK
jgi:uncharacterized protein (DUF1501 family)/uncharacterized protein (DUF1800 family)